MALVNLHIYHTNDLHSHLEQWPYIVSFLKKQRKKHRLQQEDALFFDIGDHCDRSHPITEATDGKGNIELMNMVGFAGVTIGNNEGITFSKQQLDQLFEEANFPVVVANLFEEGGEIPTWAKPYQIHQLAAGYKVAVIAVTVPFFPFYTKLGWLVKDPLDVLPDLIAEVRKQADFVVLLSHVGLHFDEQIAEQLEGIDVILGGHTHHLLQSGENVKGTLIGQAGKFGHSLGQIKLMIDDEKKQIVDYEIGTVEMTQHEACPETEALMNRLQTKTKEIMNEPLATLSEGLAMDWYEESAFAQLLATAVKEWCEAEISMVNAGLLLEALPPGVVTRGDLHRICPHPINPCKLKLDGQRLKETIQHALSDKMVNLELKGYGFRGKVLGVMVFDGVEVKVKTLADGLHHVEEIRILNEPIDLEREYEIATLDMFTFGKLYPEIAAAKTKEYFMPEMLRDILAWKLKQG